MDARAAALLAALSLVLCPLTDACPRNETVLALCSCQDSNNGIMLDCSNQASTLVDALMSHSYCAIVCAV